MCAPLHPPLHPPLHRPKAKARRSQPPLATAKVPLPSAPRPCAPVCEHPSQGPSQGGHKGVTARVQRSIGGACARGRVSIRESAREAPRESACGLSQTVSLSHCLTVCAHLRG
eukprot:5625696-Pyramimonas_sp.AAC.1